MFMGLNAGVYDMTLLHLLGAGYHLMYFELFIKCDCAYAKS
jgi:hypothetical protein